MRFPRGAGRSRQQGFCRRSSESEAAIMPLPPEAGRSAAAQGISLVSRGLTHRRETIKSTACERYWRSLCAESRRAAGSRRIRPCNPHHSSASARPTDATMAPATSANAMNPFMAALRRSAGLLLGRRPSESASCACAFTRRECNCYTFSKLSRIKALRRRAEPRLCGPLDTSWKMARAGSVC
jgi:hypothetical protein